MSIKVRLVRYLPEIGWLQEESKIENVEAFMGVRGFHPRGYNNNPRQRKELQGMPVFSSVAGPMWDGDAIRYENREAYDRLSA